jgi:hypothetical protein
VEESTPSIHHLLRRQAAQPVTATVAYPGRLTLPAAHRGSVGGRQVLDASGC